MANFADRIKNFVVEGALKKEEVFSEQFINKDNIKQKLDMIRALKDDHIESKEARELLDLTCNLLESLIDSEPVITIKINK